MIDPFEEQIQQLGEQLDIPLHVDANRACLLQIEKNLSVQIQTDTAQEKILLISLIAELPPGAFREKVLCQGLKSNHLPDPRTAIFSYLDAKKQLVMHQSYPLEFLNGEKLAALVAGFIEYAKLWYEAVEKGEPGPAPIEPDHLPPNPFGLK